MSKPFLLLIFLFCFCNNSNAQSRQLLAEKWADSVLLSLPDSQRIAQLMVVRVSERKKDTLLFYDDKVAGDIQKYNIGGIVLFQGGPVKEAQMVNKLRAFAKTPLLVCIDAEWGLGMRMDSIISLNHQLMLGAMDDGALIYQYGRWVAEQCRRAGIQVNFAPVVDVNNNPNNPIINDRSFGEDKYKVALFGTQYMKGLQDGGVLACAKHFPGHGDVTVDSHLDLPVINKSIAQLDTLELYPFKEIFKEGIGSVMVAHLYIPAIDSTPNRATSISANNVTGLLKDTIGFKGITFTDALNMQGVAKYFPGGSIGVQALIAGNDILVLPEDVGQAIDSIRSAIQKGQITMQDINSRCRKVLIAKYLYGSAQAKPVNTNYLVEDLNARSGEIKRKVDENAITLLNDEDNMFFPLMPNKKVAYLGIGITGDNAFAKRMRAGHNADVYYFDYKQGADKIYSTIEQIKSHYTSVIIGVHNVARYPANNFGISQASIDLVTQLQHQMRTIVFLFGNPYAVMNFCNAPNLVECYEDDETSQNTAADLLEGQLNYHGHLPVTVCDRYHYGNGKTKEYLLPLTAPESVGLNSAKLLVVDSLANDAITEGATPGCVVMVLKDGKVAYQKAFGNTCYPDTAYYRSQPANHKAASLPVTINTIYDIASVTKIAATTLAIMKLYDEGRIKLTDSLGAFLPWLRESNKEGLLIQDVLLHQAGLQPGLSFSKRRDSTCLSSTLSDSFPVRIADGMYISSEWKDIFNGDIRNSKLLAKGKYVYSDLDFILLGEIVESITQQPLDKYVQQQFYDPLGLRTISFKAIERFELPRFAPTETDSFFRMQQLLGDVDDPTAALLGGVAGHAGVFSTASDLAVVMQMLVQGGVFNGKRYIQDATIKLFTQYHSDISRRGYGFDKPEKDNATRQEAYPSLYAFPSVFGHTGFTGTCAWADPESHLVYVFLSNRVSPTADNKKLLLMNVRVNILDAIYQAFIPATP